MNNDPFQSDTRYTYDVALSLANEDRPYVDQVAAALRNKNLRVFYDEYELLWGKDLYPHLTQIYQHQARFIVMFISRHYAQKLWTNHERQAAQARGFTESYEYILPARFDDTAIEGFPPSVAYVDLRKTSPGELADLVVRKLLEAKLRQPEPQRPHSTVTFNIGSQTSDQLINANTVTIDQRKA